MGPRRCGRGKGFSTSRSGSRDPRFNGAATLWSRKAAGEEEDGVWHEASMGPRRCGRGKIVIVSVAVPISWLQWGRDAVVAESLLFAGNDVHAPRRLQWGRDAVVAERRYYTKTSRTRNTASMGPRRCGRGKRSVQARHPRGHWLQWGRDAVVAESAARDLAVVDVRGFNGAATLWSRKAGPRAAQRRRRKCFNGAATLWSRKDRDVTGEEWLTNSFNGAATLWSRKG